VERSFAFVAAAVLGDLFGTTRALRQDNPHWTVYGNLTFCEESDAMSDEIER
jgi:hypothetical protein